MATYYRLQHVGNVSYTDQLSGSITSTATSFTLKDGSTFPDGSVGDFVVTVDPDTASEEKILCSARSGSTFTVAPSGRGWDGTTAAAHNANASVIHTLSAAELDWANQLVNLLLVNLGTANQVPASDGTTINWKSPLTLAETMFGSAGQLLAGTGSGSGELLAKGSSGQVLKVGGSDSSGLEWDGVGLLATAEPTGNSYVAGTSWEAQGSPAWNVTFTAPASGNVLIRLTGLTEWVDVSGTSLTTAYWGVATHGTTTPIAAAAVATGSPVASGTVPTAFYCVTLRVTGLTAGTSYTYDWIGATSSSSVGFSVRSSATTPDPTTATQEAQALMEVWAA